MSVNYAPQGSVDIDGFSSVHKTVDETINNDANLDSDADLTFSVEANKIYVGTMYLTVLSQTDPDFKYVFAVPAGATGQMMAIINDGFWAGTGSDPYKVESVTITKAGEYNNDPKPILQQFYIIVGDTAGTVDLQWAQINLSATDCTLHKGSWIMYKQVD